jgi:protein-disulfide isomerase
MSRLALALLLVAGVVLPVAAQVDLTVDPARTRGPATAPVTIVEFSDFE